MPRPQISRVLVCAHLFGVSVLMAEPPSRIHQHQISNAETFTLKGNVHPLTASAADQGEVSSDLVLPHVSIHFQMTTAQQVDLAQFLKNVQDRSSSAYHKFLSPQQYGDRFGLSSSDMAKVVSWLQSVGFADIRPAASRTSVTMTANASQVQNAFRVSLHRYTLNGNQHYANASEPVLPKALDGIVAGVRGLNDFHPHARNTSLHPHFTSSISGDHFIAPDDFATIYDLHTLYNGGTNGAGVTVAIAGQTDIANSDIEAFESASGLPIKDPTVQLTDQGDPGSSTSDVGEADLDIEWSGAVARGATILFVNSSDAFYSLQYTIENQLAPVVSISYGSCESQTGTATLNSMNALFQQANAQGMTIVAAAGDFGPADCDQPTDPTTIVATAKDGLAVDFPGSSPYVTSVGGTAFTDGGTTFATQYWSASNSSSNGSALSYIPETVWNDTSTANGIAAGAGGASSVFTKPAWQQATGVPSDGKRDVPDVSLTASPSVDPVLICDSGWCTNGFRNSSSYLDTSGGTSVGAPTFAGIVALLVQKTGGPVGNVNPTLYQLFSAAPNAFHDITTGNNEVPCTLNTANCTTGTFGYSAGTGYDLASGLGSVDATNLVQQWPDFQMSLSQTAVTLAAGTTAQITANITRTALYSNPVTLTCASNQSIVTCAVTGSVSASGTATVTITRSAAASTWFKPHWNWPPPVFPACALLLGASLLLLKRKRQILWGGAAFAMLALAGCGGGGSAANTAQTVTPVPTSATVTVTATSGALPLTSTVNVTLD